MRKPRSWGGGRSPAARVAVVAALGACTSPLVIEEVREPLDPPRIYSVWWEEAEGCALVFGGSVYQVDWYVTNWFPGQPGVLGQWNERHEITIRRDARFDKGVVMHEIVHELLDGDGRHTDPAWTACQEVGLIVGTEG